MKDRSKAAVLLFGMICMSILLIGCGKSKMPQDLSVPAVSVTEKGKVSLYLVEDFDKSYYHLSELETMIDAELEAFNQSHAGEEAAITKLSLSELEAEGHKVALLLEFRDASCYRDYTGTDLFYGTVSQAHSAGYDLGKDLSSAKDGTILGMTELLEMGNDKILIVEGDFRIFGPGKVKYVSAAAVLNEDGSVEASDTEENTYILMK